MSPDQKDRNLFIQQVVWAQWPINARNWMDVYVEAGRTYDSLYKEGGPGPEPTS